MVEDFDHGLEHGEPDLDGWVDYVVPAYALAELRQAGITDANGAVRLRLHAQLFDCLNRLWEQAEAVRQA